VVRSGCVSRDTHVLDREQANDLRQLAPHLAQAQVPDDKTKDDKEREEVEQQVNAAADPDRVGDRCGEIRKQNQHCHESDQKTKNEPIKPRAARA
jgi:hypothetical protein